MCLYIDHLLGDVVKLAATDLHLHVGVVPMVRVNGELEELKGHEALTAEEGRRIVLEWVSEEGRRRLEHSGGYDFGYSHEDGTRFRVNVYKAMGEIGIVMRKIPKEMISLEAIGYPVVVKDLLKKQRGLILVTGPTGSGKTTTMAAMVDWINENRGGHIITIEDPIEYLHKSKKGVVTQREVGRDVPTFYDALRSVLRQDPDVILVGEMRDYETIRAAVTAAETGHLVLATLHTNGAAKTVDRIVDMFPEKIREEARVELASSILSVISQSLLRKTEGGLVAAYEIMVTTDAIANLIRENKAYRITSEIQTGAKYGMVPFDTSLMNLYRNGDIGMDDVITYAYNSEEVKKYLQPPLM